MFTESTCNPCVTRMTCTCRSTLQRGWHSCGQATLGEGARRWQCCWRSDWTPSHGCNGMKTATLSDHVWACIVGREDPQSLSMQSRVLFEYNHNRGDESQSVLRSCSAVRLHAWWEQANQKEVQGRLPAMTGTCDDLCVYFPFLPVNASSPQLPLTLGKSLFVACFLKGMVWLFSCQANHRWNWATGQRWWHIPKALAAARLDLPHRQRSENALQVGDPDPSGILGGLEDAKTAKKAMPNYLDRHGDMTHTVHYIKSKSKHDTVGSVNPLLRWGLESWQLGLISFGPAVRHSKHEGTWCTRHRQVSTSCHE